MSFITPDMNLIQPAIGVDSGLAWENAINANSAIIDGHNHSPGYGVQISPSGMNINAPLPFNNFQATNLQAAVFTAQTSLATLLAIYCIGNDLYYNDGAGNVVQITSGGSVNATSSGISSGTATASFVSSVLVVNAAANTPADIQGGSLRLGNNIPASNFLTLAPPSAMASDFTLVLPTIPIAASFLSIDSLGNISAYAALSGGLTASNLSASAGIVGSQLSASAGIVGSQLSASAGIVGSQLSASAGIVGTQIANSTIALANLAFNAVTSVQTTTAAIDVSGGGGTTPTLTLNTTPGGIGTLMMAYSNTASINNFGTTISGANLIPCAVDGALSGGASPAGTWQCLGRSDGTGGSSLPAVTLWQRLS